MRWWDGAQWTGYVSGPPPAQVAPPDLVGERGLARWLRPALLVGGVAQAVTLVTSVDQAQWIVDHWNAITRPGGGQIPSMPAVHHELARPAQRRRRLRGRDPVPALVLPGREHRLVLRPPGAARAR